MSVTLEGLEFRSRARLGIVHVCYMVLEDFSLHNLQSYWRQ